MEYLANRSLNKMAFAAITAITAWFAIVLQFYLTTGSIGNFFSFFTIQCNLLVAISTTTYLLIPNTKIGRFFESVSVQSAIALYIFIVALVYNTVLRGLLVLTGINWLVDNILHVIVPLLYVLYYLAFIEKGQLKWKDGISWIYFPLAYLIYSLIRGAFTNWYPYPFLNVTKIGFPKTLLNVTIMIAVFFVAGLLLIAFNRSKTIKNNF